MTDLVFEAVQEADGGYCAECLTEKIFTDRCLGRVARARNRRDNSVLFRWPRPRRIRLHLVRDEILYPSHETATRRFRGASVRDPVPVVEISEVCTYPAATLSSNYRRRISGLRFPIMPFSRLAPSIRFSERWRTTK